MIGCLSHSCLAWYDSVLSWDSGSLGISELGLEALEFEALDAGKQEGASGEDGGILGWIGVI